MVIIHRFLFLIITFFAVSSATAQIPQAQDVQTLVAEIQQDLEALNGSVNRSNVLALEEDLQRFKAMIAQAGQAVERERGGAVTPQSSAAVRTIAQFGIDMANAMFAFRSEHAAVLADSGLEQKFEDIMVNELEYPMLQMAFKVLRHKVDERSGVDGRVSYADVFRRTFMEVGRDFLSLVRVGRNRTTGEMFYTPIESSRRERLARDLIQRYHEYAVAHIPEFNRLYDGDLEYNRENHEERLGGLLLWLTDRAVNIRVERDSAQWYARTFYAISGVVLAQPVFNFLGDSYTAHLETSVMTLSAFATLYVIKAAASSAKSTRAWLAFNQEVRKQMAAGLVESTEIYLAKTFPTEYRPAQVPGWVQRRANIVKAIDGYYQQGKSACMRLLGIGQQPAQ